MSSARDWDEARRDLLAEGRKRVGPPPEVETVEALLRGELSADEEQRVRAVLAYYPELVRVMTAPGSAPEEAGLSPAEREEDLARIRARLGISAAPVVPMQPRRRDRSQLLAVAAVIIIALLICGAVVLQRWQSHPRSLITKVLIADAERGTRGSPVPPALLERGTDYLLKPLYRPSRAYDAYRFELLDLRATPPHSLWQRDGILRQADGSYPVELSTGDLEPGDYQLVLEGGAERLATYTLRIERP